METRLVAIDSEGMQLAQRKMGEWLAIQLEEKRTALSDLEENLQTAIKNNWRQRTIKGAIARIKQDLIWLDKVKIAIDAGFALVPNFPCDIFAIRVDREMPTAPEKIAIYQANVRDERAEELPAGEGRYESTDQFVENDTIKTSDGREMNRQVAIEFMDVEFPYHFAKPILLNATQRAMALKIFDEIAAFPGKRTRKADPVVLGRIRMRRAYTDKIATFIIGWYVDLKELV